jgi:hypothetical protein
MSSFAKSTLDHLLINDERTEVGQHLCISIFNTVLCPNFHQKEAISQKLVFRTDSYLNNCFRSF